MSKEFITIHEAAELSGKSVQTIRRALKSKKLKHRKRKTPQGFNYLVSRASLCEIYDIKQEIPLEGPAPAKETTNVVSEAKAKSEKVINEVVAEQAEKEEKAIQEDKADDEVIIRAADFHSFAQTMERMMSQHAEERQNFLRLVNTLQEKIFVLENQINLLQSPKKKWYQLWK